MVLGTVVIYSAMAPPWGGRPCHREWTPSASDVRILEAAVAKREPGFLDHSNRIYAGACEGGRRVVRGVALRGAMVDTRTGAALAPIVQVGVLHDMRRLRPMDGQCLIATGRERPSRIRLNCLVT
jgi:hypothetical protein